MKRTLAFCLALNAWSWACAFTCHEVTWADTTIYNKGDEHREYSQTAPRWYSVPLVFNLLGGYALIIAVAYKCKVFGDET